MELRLTCEQLGSIAEALLSGDGTLSMVAHDIFGTRHILQVPILMRGDVPRREYEELLAGCKNGDVSRLAEVRR